MGSVKCADCGFLSMRETVSRRILEVERETRETGHRRGDTDGMPFCFKFAHRIDKVCSEAAKSERQGTIYPLATILKVIQEDRECDEFFRWRPGRSAEEHDQMLDNQLLRESLEKREVAQRDWQESRDQASREWQESQNNKNRTRQLHLAIFAAIVGTIGLFLGKWLSSQPQPQPIIIQVPVEPKK